MINIKEKYIRLYASDYISGYKKQGFRPITQRCVIERTFVWFDNNKRLCRNDDTSFDVAEQMVKISAIKLLLNKIYVCYIDRYDTK